MQNVMFITRDNGKITKWCQTNDMKMFRNFIQYVLDNCSKPEEYEIIDIDNNVMYKVMDVVENLRMRKRTFQEKLKDVQTGVWVDWVTS